MSANEMEVYSRATGLAPLPLSDLPELAARVERLIDELPPGDAADELIAARAKAEAASLWAQRTKHAEGERHYGKMRLLAEAGLGVLSLNGHAVDGNVNQVKLWRVLAAGFERGKLLQCSEKSTVLADVASEVRRRGLMFVPFKALKNKWGNSPHSRKHESWRWSEARVVCREQGIDPKTLPPDTRRVEAESENRSAAALQRSQDAERFREQTRRRRIMRAASGSGVEETYGFIRQALDALGRVPTDDIPIHRKSALNDAFAHLHKAEDAIAEALKLGS